MNELLENPPELAVAEVYVPSREKWEEIKDSVIALEKNGFKEKAFAPEELEKDFLSPRNTIVVLKDGGEVVGFTYARPLDEADEPGRESELHETAYMWDTVIREDYRGRHLVGPMMKALEDELRKRGYSFVERVAAVANGYAENIQKNYADRIVASEPRETEYGKQVFFRIKL